MFTENEKFVSGLLDEMQDRREATNNKYKRKILDRFIAILEEQMK